MVIGIQLSRITMEPLLITYFEDVLAVNGTNFESKGSPILLGPLKQNKYSFLDAGYEFQKSGQSIVIDDSGRKITISTSWFGEYQLFYYIDSSNILICSSYETAVDYLRGKNILLEVDEVAIWESLVFEHPLRSRTFCKQIKKILLGKKMEFFLKPVSLNITASYTLRYCDSSETPDEEELTSTATGILSALITPQIRRMLQGKKILLLLSGGVDSRLLGALLKKNDIPFECVTYGPWESADPYVAKLVANALGARISHLLLEDTDYKTFGDDVTVFSGGLSFHMHSHVYSVLKRINIKYDFIIHGNLAERSIASEALLPIGALETKEQAMDDVLAYKAETTRSWELIDNDLKREILRDLWESMEECSSVNKPGYFYDYFSKVESNSFLYSAIFNTLQPFGTPFSPYANDDFQEFFCSLPTRYREEKYLFKKACKRLFPRESSIGTPERILGANPLINLVEQGLSKALNVISFGAFIASGGRLWIPNPKNFERHRKVLFGVLKEDFLEAVNYLSAMLDVDLSRLSKASYFNRIAVREQYRILSCHVFIKHFGLVCR